MSATEPDLLQRARGLGIQATYWDVHGRLHHADPTSLAVVVEALETDASAGGPQVVEPVVVAPARWVPTAGAVTDVELILHDGTVVPVEPVDTDGATGIVVPAGLPVGCHTLHVTTPAGSGTGTVVCPPASMTSAAAWAGGSGLFVPTYALWDHDRPLPSFGLLGRLARALGSLDTRLLTTLPLYATFLDDPFEPSPYSPISRLHWNESFIDDGVMPTAPIPHQGRYLDWAAVATRRRAQLLDAVDDLDAGTRSAVERFVAERPDVTAFARFMADRTLGDDRTRNSHELAQFLADRQLADVAEIADHHGAGLAIDLPIGCHVDGYERWAHPELFASGCTIGAPPDLFFTAGQNWGLPPQLPAAGRRSGHRLWRDLLARAGEHAALLRIDHVMAVHRLWWVPEGLGAHQGVYVTYPREELLAVIAATAATSGTTVVGEDLGTVPQEVADALARWEMLGMYEEQFHAHDEPLPEIPARTVAGIRTHDMQPFTAFVRENGSDLAGYRHRLSRHLGREVGEAYGDVLDAVLERLAASASAMVTVDIDDLQGEAEPHNIPGMVLDSNWRRRLDRPLSDVLADPDLRRRLHLLGDRPHGDGVTDPLVVDLLGVDLLVDGIPHVVADRRLGATVRHDGVDTVTRFEVWAPAAASVELCLVPEREDGLHDVGHATGTVRSMAATADGHWRIDVQGAGHGQRYRFSLDGGTPLPDPASAWQPDGVHGPSAVVDAARFAAASGAAHEWTDADWRGRPLDEYVLYELHVGAFTPDGTFDAAIGQLDRLAGLGVTAVEVMPVNAFAGAQNWGYDGVFPFAVQASYGGPAGFARFVDAAHARGLAVVLDVVYNHLGPEGNVLHHYGPYFTSSYLTPWGAALNVMDEGSDGVRRYVLENIERWIGDYHLDGFRLDAVNAVVDTTANPLWEQVGAVARQAGRRARRRTVVIAESSDNDPRYLRGADRGGHALDAVWNDDLHHSLRVAVTGDGRGYYADYRGDAAELADIFEHRWKFRGGYSVARGRHHGRPADDLGPQHFVVCSQNHDQIGNRASGDRLDHHASPADRRLLAATILLSPFTPMLFMGEEYGEPAPFPFFVDHQDVDILEATRSGRRDEFPSAEWGADVPDPADPATFRSATLHPELAGIEPHRSLLAMYTRLIDLRRSIPAVAGAAAHQRVRRVGDLVVVDRWIPGDSSGTAGTASSVSTLLVNLGDAPAATGLTRRDGQVSVAFDSADTRWGGPGAGARLVAADGDITVEVAPRTLALVMQGSVTQG